MPRKGRAGAGSRIRSPLTTPPATISSDQIAVGFPAKLPDPSRAMAYTVIAEPAARFCGGTTDPVPSAAVSTVVWTGEPATTVWTPETLGVPLFATAWMTALPVRCALKVALEYQMVGARSPPTTPARDAGQRPGGHRIGKKIPASVPHHGEHRSCGTCRQILCRARPLLPNPPALVSTRV